MVPPPPLLPTHPIGLVHCPMTKLETPLYLLHLMFDYRFNSPAPWHRPRSLIPLFQEDRGTTTPVCHFRGTVHAMMQSCVTQDSPTTSRAFTYSGESHPPLVTAEATSLPLIGDPSPEPSSSVSSSECIWLELLRTWNYSLCCPAKCGLI